MLVASKQLTSGKIQGSVVSDGSRCARQGARPLPAWRSASCAIGTTSQFLPAGGGPKRRRGIEYGKYLWRRRVCGLAASIRFTIPALTISPQPIRITE